MSGVNIQMRRPPFDVEDRMNAGADDRARARSSIVIGRRLHSDTRTPPNLAEWGLITGNSLTAAGPRRSH